MYKKIRTITLGLVLAATLIITGIATIKIVSAAQTTIYVDPAEIIDLSLTPDNPFTINISVSDVADPGLYAYEFKLFYDNTLLKATAWALPEGHFLTPADGEMPIYLVPASGIYQEDGYVLVAATLQGDAAGKTGAGTLVTVTFNVTSIGSCALDLTETILADPDIDDISHEIIDGYFSNEPAPSPAKLRVHPASIGDPTLVPNQNFTINVTISEVENLYGYEFKLGYNTSVLDGVDVIVSPFENETNFIAEHSIDNAAGMIWVNVTHYSPAEPITTYPPATLVNITFQVLALGESVLDLYDTNLVDQLGEPISHDVSDGYFRNLAVRDLAIVDVILSRTHAYEKFREHICIINITVVVRNEGDTTETFDLSTHYDDTLIGTQPITDLDPDSNATVKFRWNTTDLPLYVNYTVKAYAHEVLGEISTDNNLYVDGIVIISMFGDTDGDKKVDIQDVAEAAKAFGSYTGHTRWNPRSDLDNDGVVSVIDMVLIAMNFGRVF
ncbi:MAG: cohesin domain-containing protein [Candidatus Bathyarchaeota archaeon]|nr:cohesin domain-containing protein [Candidatus Bathyarchaeota archaeon]